MNRDGKTSGATCRGATRNARLDLAKRRPMLVGGYRLQSVAIHAWKPSPQDAWGPMSLDHCFESLEHRTKSSKRSPTLTEQNSAVSEQNSAVSEQSSAVSEQSSEVSGHTGSFVERAIGL